MSHCDGCRPTISICFRLHDVEFGDVQQIIHETLPALRQLQQQGKARYIGITGYPPKLLRRIAEAAPVDSILTLLPLQPA